MTKGFPTQAGVEGCIETQISWKKSISAEFCRFIWSQPGPERERAFGAAEQCEQTPRGGQELGGLGRIRMAGSWGGTRCTMPVQSLEESWRTSKLAHVSFPACLSLCHGALYPALPWSLHPASWMTFLKPMMTFHAGLVSEPCAAPCHLGLLMVRPLPPSPALLFVL